MKIRIRNSVSIVKLDDSHIEFFLSDIRKIKQLKVENANLFIDLIRKMDGKRSIKELSDLFDIEEVSLNKFMNYLQKNHLLVTEEINTLDDYKKFRRIINFLGNYKSESELLKSWQQLKNSQVAIIGAGTVGTWVAINLIQSGVSNIILIDDDTIDITNIHRQLGYFPDQVSESKVASLKERLLSLNPDANVIIRNTKILSERDLATAIGESTPNLVINSADFPTVDKTSTWIGEYCMSRKIPHIIGGGYNLHLSLVGQTILPFKSACMKCIEKQLQEDEHDQFKSLKKMEVQNRKIGSLGPASNIIASFIGMEAIKVLAHLTIPANINRRGEFDILNMKLSFKNFIRDPDCVWCGTHGKYTKMD